MMMMIMMVVVVETHIDKLRCAQETYNYENNEMYTLFSSFKFQLYKYFHRK